MLMTMLTEYDIRQIALKEHGLNAMLNIIHKLYFFIKSVELFSICNSKGQLKIILGSLNEKEVNFGKGVILL